MSREHMSTLWLWYMSQGLQCGQSCLHSLGLLGIKVWYCKLSQHRSLIVYCQNINDHPKFREYQVITSAGVHDDNLWPLKNFFFQGLVIMGGGGGEAYLITEKKLFPNVRQRVRLFGHGPWIILTLRLANQIWYRPKPFCNFVNHNSLLQV